MSNEYTNNDEGSNNSTTNTSNKKTSEPFNTSTSPTSDKASSNAKRIHGKTSIGDDDRKSTTQTQDNDYVGRRNKERDRNNNSSYYNKSTRGEISSEENSQENQEDKISENIESKTLTVDFKREQIEIHVNQLVDKGILSLNYFNYFKYPKALDKIKTYIGNLITSENPEIGDFENEEDWMVATFMFSPRNILYLFFDELGMNPYVSYDHTMGIWDATYFLREKNAVLEIEMNLTESSRAKAEVKCFDALMKSLEEKLNKG